MNLYEISSRYQQAFFALAECDDLPAQVIDDTLEGIEGEIKEKAIAVASFFQNLEAEANAIYEAENRMRNRRSALEKKIASLKDYLKTNMEKTGITEITCPQFSLKIKRNPPAVCVFDEGAIPVEYKKEKTVITIDKAAIKRDGGCEGAIIESSTRLEIK